MQENYVYKKEVDWSLLVDGLTIPLENQVVFARNMGRLLSKGEKKEITVILKGCSYKAKIVNVNFDRNKYQRKDIYQIRYSKGSELAVALRNAFVKSYNYFIEARMARGESNKGFIKAPEESREYLVIYTTEYEDTYLLETVTAEDIYLFNSIAVQQDEQVYEDSVNYDVCDESASIVLDERVVKVRKLNRAVGENLKLLYNYRCQICGESIGEKYGASVVEAHHIDYYVNSMNNDAKNILVICPNHHRIIHAVNPRFDREKKIYIYGNEFVEELFINHHLW